MYQLEGHMYIWKQTRICKITSSTILVMSIFSWLSNNENASLRTNILLWTCHLHAQHKFALHQEIIMNSSIIFGFWVQTTHCPSMHIWIYTSELLHRILLWWVLTEDCEIILITSSSMVKYHIVVGRIWWLVGGLYLNFPNIRGEKPKVGQEIRWMIIISILALQKKMNLKVQKYNSSLKLNSSTTRCL